MNSKGRQSLIEYIGDDDGRVEMFTAALEKASRRDKLSTPADAPDVETVRRWLAGEDTPNHTGRRLVQLATGGRQMKDKSIRGGAVQAEWWEVPADRPEVDTD